MNKNCSKTDYVLVFGPLFSRGLVRHFHIPQVVLVRSYSSIFNYGIESVTFTIIIRGRKCFSTGCDFALLSLYV